MAKASISIIIFLFFIFLPPSYSNNNHTDFEALLSFKKSIRKDPLRALSSWNQTRHFCKWNGVSCSRRHPNRVVSVILHSQGLVGPLSPHIGNLSFLRTFILQNNTFHGRIPQEIGRLKRLETIIFNNNSFQGEIPRNLTHCTNLQELHLIDNKLTGAILPELGSLSKLEQLRLSINLISGAIPPSLGNLTNLIKLSLAENSLQGEIPACLARMQRLQRLILHDNSLSGSVPLGLYNLSSMELLSLGTNRLHGSVPSSLASTLPKLNFLDLGYNHFTGELPPSLSNSSQIQRVRLSYNYFTGDLIDFARVSALEDFFVSSNHLKGDVHTIFSSLTNCTRLRNLGLDGIFTGSLPDSIGNLSTHLSSIWIYENQITGRIPSTIRNLVGLTFLNAEANSLRGPIPASIGELHKLQEIFLGENQLTGEMPYSFCNSTLLIFLLLQRNNLLGNIPPCLGNCSDLLILDLSHNSFNGTIPLEIIRLYSITIGLDLSHNLLRGAIPSEVGNLRNNICLDLSHNRLSGTIPTSLSSCVMLDFLNLGSNSLGGKIPEGLMALRGLEHLDLSSNNFSGEIPRFLVEFRLLYLDLSFNELQGEVPTVGVFRNESAISLQGNHGLCGGSAFLNLPSCSSTNSTKKLNLGKILIPTAAGAICLALASGFCFCVIMYRRRTLRKVASPKEICMAPEFLRLSYADLFKATAGFLESNLVGAGRFGCVYRGNIIVDVDERIVAVKVLNLDVRGVCKSLASECKALRGIRHRNLLKILSVCDSIDSRGNGFKALVYEFMANGSLEDWLHRNPQEQGSRIPLSFIQRLDIAIDVASAVDYLHWGTESIVIHGDLKPSNILLDQHMVAHVGDFGLAKIISSSSSEGRSSSTTSIKGTIGYIPPEYGTSAAASTQGDAYSYGILVLEMFTNTRPTSTDTNLRDFVSSALPDHVMEVVDPFLRHQLNQGGDNKHWECIASILSIGVRCSMELPRDRMSMAEVVNDLKKIRTGVALFGNHNISEYIQHLSTSSSF